MNEHQAQIDAEHERAWRAANDTTPEGVLRRIAALVKLLPSQRPELWCALPVDAAATLPGATVTVQQRSGQPGKVLHVARATVDGLLVVALEPRDATSEEREVPQ